MWVDAVGISCSFQAKSGLARYEGLLQWMAIGGKSAVRGYKYARDMLDDRTDSGSAIVSDEERLVGGASRSMTQVVGDMSVFAIVLDLASLRRLLVAVFILSSLPSYRCLDLDTRTFTIEVTFVVIRLEPNGNIASRMDRPEYMQKSPCIYGIFKYVLGLGETNTLEVIFRWRSMGNDMRGDSMRGRKENGGECAKIDIDLWFNVALPIVSGQCTNALGMESGEIPNEDITASSMYDPSLGPKHA
ncbi:discoidin domain-containing receptor 2 isoform X2, partial [Vespula squamosa]